MTKYSFIKLSWITFLLLNGCLGSHVSFTCSPQDVIAGVTPTLTLTCEHKPGQPSQAPSNGIIGKRDLSSADLSEVNSIVIMDKVRGSDIASVGRTHPPRIMDQSLLQNANVTGVVNFVPGQDNFLKIVFNYPTSAAQGEYTCLVNGLESDNDHAVTLSSAVAVEVAQPTTEDILLALREVRSREVAMGNTINEMATTIKDLQTCCNATQSDLQNLNETTKAQTTKLTELKTKVETGVAFSAVLAKDVNLPRNGIVKYDHIYSNYGNAYDQSTGKFTCSVPGLYKFCISGIKHYVAVDLDLRKNGHGTISVVALSDNESASECVILSLVKGDVVDVTAAGASPFLSAYQQYNSFSGHLIFQT